jgi:hypothetical protein
MGQADNIYNIIKYTCFVVFTGEEVLHEGWSYYDNLFRSICDNCHGVCRKTSVYTTKTLIKGGYFYRSKMSFRCRELAQETHWQ